MVQLIVYKYKDTTSEKLKLSFIEQLAFADADLHGITKTKLNQILDSLLFHLRKEQVSE